MTGQYILSDYLDRALSQAEYDKLEDGTFFGRIPSCKGVVAFAASLRECEDELRSVLEDWVLVGLKLGHDLPILDSLDLNRNPEYESLGFAHEILKLNDLCSKSSTTSAK